MCLICGCAVIARVHPMMSGICTGCGADEGQEPIERKLTSATGVVDKIGKPPKNKESTRESGDKPDRQYHGSLFGRGEW